MFGSMGLSMYTTSLIITPSSFKKEKSLRSWSACAEFFRPKAMKRKPKRLKGVGNLVVCFNKVDF
jgi:hypothetical protein